MFTVSRQKDARGNLLQWGLIAGVVAVLCYFYGYIRITGLTHHNYSVVDWAWHNWVPVKEMAHGRVFPLLIAFLIWRIRDKLAAAEKKISWVGLIVVFVGILAYLCAYRTIQARVALFSLPIVVWGCVYFLWGRKVALLTLFPIFIFWLAIPMPALQQATGKLAIWSTKIAYFITSSFGIDVVAQGTRLLSPGGDWNFSIDDGCSGIRSLMALTLIASLYAYLMQGPIWKKVVLFLTAIPLAILANSVRIIMIVGVAEWIDAKLAAGPVHDFWAPYSIFIVALFGLMAVHWLLNISDTLRRKTVKTTVKNKPIQSL